MAKRHYDGKAKLIHIPEQDFEVLDREAYNTNTNLKNYIENLLTEVAQLLKKSPPKPGNGTF